MGDWRERVRAAKASPFHGLTSETIPPQPSADVGTLDEGKKKDPVDNIADRTPTAEDLEELSAGLPTGWQAMWDSTSGNVYYGNLVTKVGTRFTTTKGFKESCTRVRLPRYC
jgi:hypothetical protein